MLVVYGIKTCDTVKKALNWLDAQSIAYAFHDLRADGLSQHTAQRWVDALGWESALNRRSTTWRGLPEADKCDLDPARAAALLVRYPTLAKRPVFEKNSMIFNGFTETVRAKLVA